MAPGKDPATSIMAQMRVTGQATGQAAAGVHTTGHSASAYGGSP
jgi:hypothetical protein